MQKNDAAQPYVIPRASLTWLLASHIAVMLPHILRIPVWMSIVSILCVSWRILVFRQRASFPSKWIKTLLVLGSVGGILLQYHTLLGSEAGTSLLLVMFDLKLIEMLKKRDAYVVVVLAYFVAATQFMFSTSIVTAFYGFTVIAFVTAALLGLHQNSTHRKPLRTAKLALKLILQAVPLMIVLFYLFPRLPPFWAVNMEQKRAQLGFSEEMSPGDFSSLGKSDGLAFRVEFNGPPPPKNELYWRGTVLSHFDGHKWTVTEHPEKFNYPWVNWGNDLVQFAWNRRTQRDLNSAVEYSIILEPHDKKWLFALDTPITHAADIGLTREYNLIRKENVVENIRYSLTSYKKYTLDPQLDAALAQRNLSLPTDSNPKTREFAQKLFEQSKHNPQLYIQNILNWYNTDNFTYTLKPPSLGKDSIDEFLFSTQRGFCEHFSSATTFLARAVGIPARVVVGYQGGEWNELGKHFLVHQYDAHAWTEVWLEQQGWVRVDGTASVSPARIEKGIDSALQDEQSAEGGAFSATKLRQNPLLGRLRLSLDYVDFAWYKYVLGFDTLEQEKLFQRLFGAFDSQRIGLLILLIFAAIFSLIALFIFSESTKTTVEPITRLYLDFCRLMAKRGLVRQIDETPNAYAKRLSVAFPLQAEQINGFNRLYASLAYGKPQDSAEKRDAIKRLHLLLRAINKGI